MSSQNQRMLWIDPSRKGYNVWIIGNRCYRCGHEWKPINSDKIPKVCPKCKSPYWNVPKKEEKNND